MRVLSGLLVGIAFGAASIVYALVQIRFPYYFSPLVQPIASIVILLVLGILSQLFARKRHDASQSLWGSIWLLIVVVTSSLIMAVYAYTKAFVRGEYFFPQLQLYGLGFGLVVAFIGYGLCWLVRTAIEEARHDDWRPRG